MNEFKGTKGEYVVDAAIADNTVLYYDVKVDGHHFASFTENIYLKTTLDMAKANAVLFSKAPQMLEILQYMLDNGFCVDKHGEDLSAKVSGLIQEATEL
ncbi:hypothetical protein BN1195_03632 [Chryseobacterium oranimense G311]|uniref:hypothetical protein n=1 Tax=Chryseobacterium oranimense TaxID=421058 RepID=UPI000533B8BD|nr:hypothetical protein [Chryseobacterium oranimense]CEJ71287.1 hypothetical protein BN1195_03632 [Chryseobacterium oranimense G311]DAG72849.1 MAG TPA: hypothetical protein [Caudoviricetes sp.]